MTKLVGNTLAALFLLLPVAHAADTLYLYNWNNYISDETVRRFEAHCRCTLKQDYYSDNEEMLAKLEAGAVGYDGLVPTGNAVESLIRRKALRALDKSKLPPLANLKAEYRAPWYDPDGRYAVPYASAVTLIGYNVDKLREMARLEMLRDFDPQLRRALSRMWTEIKVG